jgi:hypothetical protein
MRCVGGKEGEENVKMVSSFSKVIEKWMASILCRATGFSHTDSACVPRQDSSHVLQPRAPTPNMVVG